MFEFVRTLGKGSSGTAELVQRKADSSLFCMKVIHINIGDGDSGDGSGASFDTEVKILSKLQHPHIVGYHGSFVHNNMLHIIMDYADGGTLEDRVREAKKNTTRFSKEEVMAWVCQLVLALKYVHGKRFLHRDLKLANVFLEGRLYVKVGDFGLARALTSENQLAATACGTPYYLSPELCLGQQYDHKSDVWAMGCVIYELLTLRRPFQGQNLMAVVTRICHEECPPIPMECGKQISDLTYSMLNKAPGGRPSMSEVAELPFIKEFMENGLPGTLNSSSQAAALTQFRPRHRRVASDLGRGTITATAPTSASPSRKPSFETSPSLESQSPVSAASTPKSARMLDKPAARPPRAPQTPLGMGMASASPRSGSDPAASPVPHRIRNMFDRLHSQLTPLPDGSPRSSPSNPTSPSFHPEKNEPSPLTPVSSGRNDSKVSGGSPQPLAPPARPRMPPSPVQMGLPMARAESPVPALNEIDKSVAVTCLAGVNESPQQLFDAGSSEGSGRATPLSAATPIPSGPVDLPNVDQSLVHKFPPIAPGAGSGIGQEKLQLEAIASLARESLMSDSLIKDRGNLLRSYEQCFLGSDLMTWMVRHFAITDRNMVRHICDLLLTRKIVHHVSNEGETKFVDSADEYYRFQEDAPSDVLNMKRIWDGPVREPTDTIKTIQRHVYQVYNSFVVQNGKTVEYSRMKGSTSFAQFALAMSELQVLDISPLPFREKLAFYVNTYNALYIHAIDNRGIPDGKIDTWRMHNGVSYCMTGLNYSIADIKHGILRGNQKQPFSIMRQFGDDDPRRHTVLGLLDPRVHFALFDGSISCGRLRLYNGNKIDKELQEVACAFCEENVTISTKDKVVSIPGVFKEYRSDFAPSEPELLRWIAGFLPASPHVEMLEQQADSFGVEYD